jgi:hypothetical protein
MKAFKAAFSTSIEKSHSGVTMMIMGVYSAISEGANNKKS